MTNYNQRNYPNEHYSRPITSRNEAGRFSSDDDYNHHASSGRNARDYEDSDRYNRSYTPRNPNQTRFQEQDEYRSNDDEYLSSNGHYARDYRDHYDNNTKYPGRSGIQYTSGKANRDYYHNRDEDSRYAQDDNYRRSPYASGHPYDRDYETSYRDFSHAGNGRYASGNTNRGQYREHDEREHFAGDDYYRPSYPGRHNQGYRSNHRDGHEDYSRDYRANRYQERYEEDGFLNADDYGNSRHGRSNRYEGDEDEREAEDGYGYATAGSQSQDTVKHASPTQGKSKKDIPKSSKSSKRKSKGTS